LLKEQEFLAKNAITNVILDFFAVQDAAILAAE